MFGSKIAGKCRSNILVSPTGHNWRDRLPVQLHQIVIDMSEDALRVKRLAENLTAADTFGVTLVTIQLSSSGIDITSC